MFQEETWTQQGIQRLKHFLDVMCEWPWIMRTPTIYLVLFRAIQWEFYGICLIVSLVLLQLFLYFYAERSKMHEDLSAHSNAMVCGVFCFCCLLFCLSRKYACKLTVFNVQSASSREQHKRFIVQSTSTSLITLLGN